MERYAEFIKRNQELLNCYGSVNPDVYMRMDTSTQKDVCYTERLRVEEILVKGKVRASDFFAAAKWWN